MSHNSLPNNLTEVCNAIIHFIEKNGEITIDELMQDIPGPDFPLGGTVINAKDVKAAFQTGKSNVSLKVRGDYVIEKNKIIFTSIPYRTYRNKIKEQINNNIDELEKVIIDFNDESNVGKNRLVFTAKDEKSINAALTKLFNLTDLQTTLSYNMNFIIGGTPKLCSLYDLIKNYVDHQENVLLKATYYDKDKAEARLHILLGLIAAIDKIDEVIELIKSSSNKDEAKNKIISLLEVDNIQAEAILDMKLAKLTRLDKNELINEKEEKEKLIAKYNKIINEKDYRDLILINQVKGLRDVYGDARRTELLDLTIDKEEKEIANVAPEKCVVVMTEGGLIKRVPVSTFKIQKRNGVGIKTQDDITSSIIRTNTVDSLMIFSNKGKMYRLLVNDIPEGTNATKGQYISSLVDMRPDENAAAIYSQYRDTDLKYVLFVSKNGLVKKTSLEEYNKTRKKTGMVALTIRDDDELAAVTLVKDEDILLITANGMAIRFKGDQVAAMSRTSSGIKGINLNKDDYVVAAVPIRDTNDSLALFTYNGFGKKLPVKDILTQNKGGKGLCYYKVNKTTGEVKSATLINNEDNLLLVGEQNSICISAKDVPEQGRTATGLTMLKKGALVSVSKI